MNGECKQNKCLSIDQETGKHHWACWTWKGTSSKYFNFSVPICDNCGQIGGDELIENLFNNHKFQDLLAEKWRLRNSNHEK